jgi:ferric-dicitrate binding protein FerR (iron transport regulator)
MRSPHPSSSPQGALAAFQAIQPPVPVPAATLAVTAGEVALLSAESGAWQPLAGLGAAVFAGDRLRTGPDGRAAFAIGGSASLRIDADTELRLVKPDSLDLVAGKLYIDSGDRPLAEPMEIGTRFGTVRDIGTQFEVLSTPGALRVRVRTGSVLLLDSPQTPNVRSSAGDEFELSASGALALRNIAPDDEQWAWATALAVAAAVDNGTILGYFQWIARETGKTLRFDSANTELRAQFERWSGDPRGLTPLEVLDSIVATSDFAYEFLDDGTMLVSRK